MITQTHPEDALGWPLVPIATLRVDLAALAAAHGLSLRHGRDDLDSYACLFLETATGIRLALLAYAGAPTEDVDLLIPAGLADPDAALRDILRELALPDEALMAVNRGYRTPPDAPRSAARRAPMAGTAAAGE